MLPIINSDALADAVKPFCTTNWAKKIRDLHKHLWKLPIPEYDAGNESHAALSRLGQTAAQECQELTAKLEALNGNEWLTTTNARANIRNGWQRTSDTSQAIETAVAALLAAANAPTQSQGSVDCHEGSLRALRQRIRTVSSPDRPPESWWSLSF